jgi:small subunit ribosomal protein S20
VPRTKSARKAQRQSKSRAERNRAQRSQLKSAIKKVRSAASPDEAAKAFAQASTLLDRAGRKNIVHRNTAARQKSRLSKAIAAKGGKKK